MLTIKSIFDGACSSLKFDNHLALAVHQFAVGFVNKNDDHIQFFGGNLTGVNPIRWFPSDKNEWINDVVQIDEYDTRQQINKLSSIDKSWKRANDMVNLSCCYMVHRFMNSSMSNQAKQQAMVDTLLVMQYKMFCSLMSHYFPHAADEGIAMATYAALSKKFSIKAYGNWQKVLVARCEDIITGKHRLTLERFDDDAAIVYLITDIQGRLRSMVKKLWVVFDRIHNQNAKIHSVGGMVELDGKVVIRDLSRGFSGYRRYLGEIALDRPRFIKQELLDVISSAMPTMSEQMLLTSLNYITDNVQKNKDVQALLDEVLLHAFDYLANDRRAEEQLNNLPRFLGKLKALYTAPRGSSDSLMKLRTLGEKIVGKATGSKSPTALAAVRTGVLLYLIIRTFSMNYYK